MPTKMKGRLRSAVHELNDRLFTTYIIASFGSTAMGGRRSDSPKQPAVEETTPSLPEPVFSSPLTNAVTVSGIYAAFNTHTYMQPICGY